MSDTSQATDEDRTGADEAPRTVRRVLQRVVLPEDRDLDVLPLYAEYADSSAPPTRPPGARTQADATVSDSPFSSARRPENVLDRSRVQLPADQRISFATYFNAFAASYWRMWTSLESITLVVRVSGDATVVVYRSTADGRSQRVDSADTTTDPTGEFEFDLTLKPFADGGWYWFDVFAGSDDAIVEQAMWTADLPVDQARSGTATIGITTFNRTEYCVKLLGQLAADKDVLAVVDTVLVVDQGTQKIRDQEGFDEVAESLGSKLELVEQGNLGGSGGFARAQYETLTRGQSDYVLLLDDDVVIEPESILRSVTFGDLCKVPTIVGAHMFSLYQRSQLHSYGETIDRWRFLWGPAPHVWPGHDFAAGPLRSTPWMHRRVDVDFNGWWMCLIPREVVERIGMSLPAFIKWDDAEYSVRAGDAGFPTVSMPGVAIWHVPWTDKNDALDWQAYFHHRNRTLAALLHSPYDKGGRIVVESFNHQIKHLLAMQYSTAELRLQALEDLLSGPDHLHQGIGSKLGEVRELRKTFTDSRQEPHPDRFPRIKRKTPRKGREGVHIGNRGDEIKYAAKAGIKQFLPSRPNAEHNPEARIAAREAPWFVLAQYDSAVVSTADGQSVSWYKRDRGQFKRLLARSVRVHERFHREWDRLSQEYRDALVDITGPEAWARTFAEHAIEPPAPNQER